MAVSVGFRSPRVFVAFPVLGFGWRLSMLATLELEADVLRCLRLANFLVAEFTNPPKSAHFQFHRGKIVSPKSVRC